MEDNITSDSLSGADIDVASDGGEAVTPSNQPSSDTISLQEIEETLGKKFENKASALKAWKDTNSFVGKKREDIEKDVVQKLATDRNWDSLSKEVKSLREDLWYEKNPSYAPYRNLIAKVGGNPAEVVNQADFKDVFDSANGYKDTQKLKTVLESNSRIASSVDKMSKAREAMNASRGNQVAQANAGILAVEALGDILDARRG